MQISSKSFNGIFLRGYEAPTIFQHAKVPHPPLSNKAPNSVDLTWITEKRLVGRNVGRNEKRPERGVFIKALAETKSTPSQVELCITLGGY